MSSMIELRNMDLAVANPSVTSTVDPSLNGGHAPESSLKSHVAGFIDIGTNSVRLLVVRIETNRLITTLTQQKQVVRLGEDEWEDLTLRPEAMERTVLVCRKFTERAHAYGAEEIIAVATSATREARNQKEFLDRLRREAELEVRVISGKEEARLIHLGVSSAVHLGDRQALFIDIGGGSTELIVGDQGQHDFLSSLPLGAIQLASLFFLPDDTDPVTAERYDRMKRHVRDSALRTFQELQTRPLNLAIGSSGTIENLTDIAVRVLHNRSRRPDDCLTYADLKQVIRLLCERPLQERRRVPGINPERADIIIAGAAILDTLMQELSLRELRVIGERGLREGILMDYLARSELGETWQHLSVRERSVLQLGRTCQFDEVHAERVMNLALQLFDSAKEAGLPHLDAPARELLRYAAWLHDIGSFLSYSNRHAHSYYLIQHADLLGFDQSEVGIIAATVFFHRRGVPSRKYPEYANLAKPSRKTVKVLSMLLRLAELLERSHAGVVEKAKLRRVDRKHLVLEIHAEQDCPLEMWGVQDRARAVEKVLGRKVHLRLCRGN